MSLSKFEKLCSAPKNHLSSSSKMKIFKRDEKVALDPFGVKKKGSMKVKADALYTISQKYKNKYKDQYLSQARDEKLSFEYQSGNMEQFSDMVKAMNDTSPEEYFECQAGRIEPPPEGGPGRDGKSSLFSWMGSLFGGVTHEAASGVLTALADNKDFKSVVRAINEAVEDTRDFVKYKLPEWTVSFAYFVIIYTIFASLSGQKVSKAWSILAMCALQFSGHPYTKMLQLIIGAQRFVHNICEENGVQPFSIPQALRAQWQETLHQENNQDGTSRFEYQSGVSSAVAFTKDALMVVLPAVVTLATSKTMTMPDSTVYDVMTDAMKYFMALPRLSSGIEVAFEFVKKIFMWAAQVCKWAYFSREWAKFPGWDTLYDDPRVTEWIYSIQDLQASHIDGKMDINRATYSKVLKAMEIGNSLIATSSAAMRTVIGNYMRELVSLRSTILSAGGLSSGLRIEPACLVLCGLPGQGKSNFVPMLHSAIWAGILDNKEFAKEFVKSPEDYMFTRAGETQYWEGYNTSKLTCVWDDFLQFRESTGFVYDVSEIIRAINSACYNLPMAELSLKAVSFFTSELCILTSNNVSDKWDSESIRYAGALDRRLNKLRYLVRLKHHHPVNPKCKDGSRMFDPEYSKSGNLDFDEVEFLDMTRDGKICSAQEVIAAAQAAIKENKRVFDVRRKAAQDLAKEYLAKNPNGLTVEELEALTWIYHPDRPAAEKLMEDVDKESEECSRLFAELPYSDCEEEYHESKTRLEKLWKQYSSLASRILYGTATRPSMFRKATVTLPQSLLKPFEWTGLTDNPIYSFSIGTGILATALGLWWFFAREEGSIIEQGEYTPKQNKPSQNTANPMTRVSRPRPIVLQSGMENKFCSDMIRKVMRRNHYEISILIEKSGDYFKNGYATFIEDTYFVVPAHFVRGWERMYAEHSAHGIVSVLLTNCFNAAKTIRLELGELLERSAYQTTTDFAVCYAGKHTHPHPSISKLLSKRDDDKVTTAVFVLPNAADKMSWTHDVNVKYDSSPRNGVERTVANTFTYLGVKTEEGDCGSLVFGTRLPKIDRPIIGFHIGVVKQGLRSLGVGARICGEDYSLLKEAIDEKLDINQPIVTEENNLEEVFTGPFNEEGGWISQRVRKAPPKTSLKHTPAYEAWSKSDYVPAKLDTFTNEQGEEIDPYRKAIAGYLEPVTVTMPEMLVIKAKQETFSYFNRESVQVCPYQRRIFSYREAVEGIEGDDMFSAISRSTSPGYPYVLEKAPPGKRHIFGDKYFIYDTELAKRSKAEVYETIEKAKRGVRRMWIFIDHLKDERVKKHKAEIGKTRIFSATPMDLLICFRMYFGAFSSWIARNNVNNGIAIGTNVYGLGWHIAAERLQQFDGVMYDGDFKGFDKHQITLFFNHILDGINEWYNDEHSEVRRVLWYEITNSRHIYGDIVYQWYGSLPSGNPLTSLINCIYNHFLFRVCWYKAQILGRIPMEAAFNDNVYLLVMGDDNVVSSNLREFDFYLVAELMAECNMEYTPANKSEDYLELMFKDLTFLKRQWRWEPQYMRWVAPLELAVILETPYWCKGSNDPLEAFQDNLESSLRELSMHEPSVWEAWAPRMMEEARKLGVNTRYSYRDEYLAQVLASKLTF